MNELALFAGAGGGILGGVLLGWNCIGACEIERYPREVLLARQRDGILPKFPIWDDIRTFDGRPWRGLVDIITGGFPCQDISAAGKGAGINGERSGLWAEMHRIICEVRPRFAFMENSPMLTSRGLGRVLGDLAEAGYDACCTCLSAADCGAPHKRNRIWVLASDTNATRLPQGAPERLVWEGGRPQPAASRDEIPDTASSHEGNIPHSNQLRRRTPPATGDIQAEQPHALRICGAAGGGEVPDTNGAGLQAAEQSSADETAHTAVERGGHVSDTDMPGREEQRRKEPARKEHQAIECGGWWSVEPRLGRVADGVANRVDRLKSLGNGQVPIVAATAFRILYRQLTNQEYQP